MPKLVVSLPDSGDATHELHDDTITVGRLSDNGLQIEDASVSSYHAELTRDESGDYILRDIGSTNGTRLNGQELEPETHHKLQNGDQVLFGKIATSYVSENPADARPLPEAEEVAAVVAETSTRPADFANASPFQKKKKKSDPVGMGLIGLAALAIAAFAFAVLRIFSIEPPPL